MLLELAIADAYGAGFEYSDPEFVRTHNNLSNYVQHPRHGTKPGNYTDDTQMSMALAELLVSQQPWTKEVLANCFITAFKRDPREGYASSFYQFLTEVETGQEFLAKIKPHSDKSGAAMRAIPLGVLATPERVIKATTIQAAITHNTPDGINAAVAAALMSHYFIYRLGTKKDLGRFVESYVPGNWSQPWQGKVKSKGWMSVRAAITAVTYSNSLSQLLQNCIAFTGDVDTVAAIALGAASCSPEYQQDIPQHLIENLENVEYGQDYLMNLDHKLMSLVSNIFSLKNPDVVFGDRGNVVFEIIF